jgi:hypothetical protein
MRLTRGTFEGPDLAALPGVSGAGEFRFVCEGGVLQVSIGSAAYVPIATGVVSSSPWQQVGTVVDLVDPTVTEVLVADEATPPGAVATSPYADLLVPAQYGGVFLEGGAIALSATVALQLVAGLWSDTLGQRGDVTADFGTPRIRTGATAGLWRVTWHVTFEAVDPAIFTFAADFGTLTATRGSAQQTVAAGDIASLGGQTIFESFGLNQDIRIAFGSSVPADLTLLSGSLLAERIA